MYVDSNPISPIISPEELAAAMANRSAPTVTREGILALVTKRKFVKDEGLIICILHLSNTWKLVGKAAAVHDENYDERIGMHFAFEDAIRQAWPLEGYLLNYLKTQAQDPEA